MSTPSGSWRWFRAKDLADLPKGRIESVVCTEFGTCFGRFNLIQDFTIFPCPHLHEIRSRGSSTSEGLLGCPWHGWELLPLLGAATGNGPGYRVELRSEGVFVGLPPDPPAPLLLLPPAVR